MNKTAVWVQRSWKGAGSFWRVICSNSYAEVGGRSQGLPSPSGVAVAHRKLLKAIKLGVSKKCPNLPRLLNGRRLAEMGNTWAVST